MHVALQAALLLLPPEWEKKGQIIFRVVQLHHNRTQMSN